MAAIQQIGENSFALEARGSRMILEQIKGGWRMRTTNAASRVWSLGGESWKEFASLSEVEAKYKSWRGIASLVGSQSQQAH